MKCPSCGKYYFRVEVEGGEVEPCPSCIAADHEHAVAKNRARRITYHKELVVIGKGEFECSGYWLDGGLYDQVITIGDQDVYGLLDVYVQDRIEVELLRRIETEKLLRRNIAIEKELPDSDDPATLRLERSENDEKLIRLEALA